MDAMAVDCASTLQGMPTPTGDELMRIEDAATLLGVTPKAVRAYVHRGFLEGHQVYDSNTKRWKTAVTRTSVAAMKDGKLFPRSSE